MPHKPGHKPTRPTLQAPSPEELRDFEITNNLPQPPLPTAFPGAPPGTASTSKSPTNVVPKVDGNVGVENIGTSATSPLLPAAPPVGPEALTNILGSGVKDFGFKLLSPFGPGGFGQEPIERAPGEGSLLPLPGQEPPALPAGVEVDPIEELVGALTGGDLEELLRLGSTVEPIPTFATLQLDPETGQFLPGFNPETGGPLTPDPAEQAEAASFIQRSGLRRLALEQATRGQIMEEQLAGAVETEQTFTIDLPENARAASAIGQVGPVIQAATKEMVDILALPPGPDKASTAQAFLAKEMAPIPSEVRWDTATASFQNAPGFTGRQRSEETIKYLAQVKPIFEMRDTMQTVVDLQVKNESALLFARQSAAQSATLFREHMATSQIDSAEESLAKQRQFEQQQSDEEDKKFQIATLMQLMSNPTTMALSRFYGVLPQFEEFLGVDIPFGRSMNLPGGGALPGIEQWGGMTGYEKIIAREEWKATQGGTDDDFGQAMLSQQPGQATGATRVTVI